MRARVLPLLPTRLQPAGKELLDTVQTAQTNLIHGDLGPGHILVQDGAVTGIIDWTDSHLGDPALDLSWLLYGASEPMARAVGNAYGVREGERRRALGWYRLAPWYSVGHGLVTGQPEVVESALAEVIARLSGRRNG
jgi:aminoglycoside phosphotransferase (APT) family kinase protein